MHHVLWLAVLGVLATASLGAAETWWWAFEFNDPNDLPQGEGWIRWFAPEPNGCNPTIEGGCLNYDSDDLQSYDSFVYHDPGAFNCGPNEVFVMEWGLLVKTVSYWGDPSLSVHTDNARVIGLDFDVDMLHLTLEYVDIPIAEDQWHDYSLISYDCEQYDLYIDGSYAHHGSFAVRYLTSRAAFGDGWEGAASHHSWDYCRMGVVTALPGDVNCDGGVDFGDINAFVEALTTGEGYPGCWRENADINGDGSVDFADINPFVQLLTS